MFKNIKLTITYFTEPKAPNPCCAEIKLELPAVREEDVIVLHEAFRNPQKELLGRKLTRYWGTPSPYRSDVVYNKIVLSDVNWRLLEASISILTHEIAQTLCEVLHENEQLIKDKPSDKQYELTYKGGVIHVKEVQEETSEEQKSERQ